MFVKRLLQSIFLVCTFAAQFAYSQWSAQLIFSPNPSPYLSDWSSRVNTVTLIVTNLDPTPRDVKILAEIEHNNKLVAYTNADKLMPQTITSGQRTFFGENIVPMAAMHFEDNLDASTQRSGRIPDGTICVRIKVIDASTLELLAEDRKCATIISYTPPYLILPADQAILCKLGENNVIEMNSGNPRPIFRWTPVVPAPIEPVRYRLAVFEVLPGQNPSTALRSARPVFERELMGLTELIWPVEYFYPEVGKRYAWSVRALDFFGRPLVSYQDGWATPFSFTVSDDCGEGNIDIDGDGIPDINRLGEPLIVKTQIEVRITAPQTMPLDPDAPHEFTGRARSTTGGPFNYNWYLREVGTPRYISLKKEPIPSNLWLSPGTAKPNKSYFLKLVAEKNGQFGHDEVTITMGSSSEDSGEIGLRQWDEGASQSETAWSSDANRRGYASGKFIIELDGTTAGVLQSFQGAATAPSVAGDFAMQLGLNMAPAIYDWIESSWNKKHTRKNGAIVLADFNFNERARREFHAALISEIQMPALDAASKDPAYMTIKVQPAAMHEVKLESNRKIEPPTTAQKTWTAANFKFEVGGLPTAKVSKVESIGIKQTTVPNTADNSREPMKVPGKLEYPNLTFYVPQTDAQPWLDYFENFRLAGGCTPQLQKTGSLTYLASDGATELFRLDLAKICPRMLTQLPAGADGQRRIKVEMYCEDIRFSYSPSVGR